MIDFRWYHWVLTLTITVYAAVSTAPRLHTVEGLAGAVVGSFLAAVILVELARRVLGSGDSDAETDPEPA